MTTRHDIIEALCTGDSGFTGEDVFQARLDEIDQRIEKARAILFPALDPWAGSLGLLEREAYSYWIEAIAEKAPLVEIPLERFHELAPAGLMGHTT